MLGGLAGRGSFIVGAAAVAAAGGALAARATAASKTASTIKVHGFAVPSAGASRTVWFTAKTATGTAAIGEVTGPG